MIKLIVTDIDGTLVKDGTLDINPEYMDVIKKLTEKGIHFVACSGRQYCSERQLFAPVKDRIFFISDGGTLIRTSEKILKVHTLSAEIWKNMARMAKREVPDLLEPSFENEQIMKIAIYNTDHCEEKCAPVFTPYWKDKVNMACAGKEWMDCTPHGADKKSAVAFLQEYLGISPEETCTFGDNINDIEMLKNAGYSYAVANAREEVQAAAKAVCPSYLEDGVLQVLKSLL